MDMDTRVFELPDGRELAWNEAGDPDGTPVLGFHGTPGSRHQMHVAGPGVLEGLGVCVVAPDRPGYGHSTFHADRTLAGWASDVGALADHVGLDRFAVMGVSGGGPHAAACARFLDDRVTAAAIVSGVGPVAEPGSEEGMMATNRVFSRLARRAPVLNRLPFGLMTRAGRRMPGRLIDMMRSQLPAPDAAALEDPFVAAAFHRDLRLASATAGKAAAQDFALFARPWGFDLADITVPVHVWQGDVDVNVPLAHAQLQAEQIPGAVLHVLPGEGHLMSVAHLEEILRALVAESTGDAA